MAKRIQRRKRVGIFWWIVVGLCLAGLWLASSPTARREVTTVWNQAKEQISPAPAPTGAAESAGEWSGKFAYAGEPRPRGYPHPLLRLENAGYLVGYDEERQNPAWAAYRITDQTLPGDFPRPTRFEVDRRTRALVSHDTYTKSGYDRGHMAPNFAIASRFGETAQKETFLMSNVVPQNPALNQGPWRLLEDVLANRTARLAKEIWVVTGPVYEGPQEIRVKDGPVVPSAFFCIIVDETEQGPRIQAFLMAQSTPRNANFREYRTSVATIERLTGLDFEWMLPDGLEKTLEDETAAYWLE